MKQFVGIKVFRCILIFICVLYILITGGIIGYNMLGAYQEHYTEETYLFLDKTCSFNDLTNLQRNFMGSVFQAKASTDIKRIRRIGKKRV